MRKLFFILGIGCFIYSVASAEDKPTIVFGAAANKSGGQNVFEVEQPDGALNPLGNPLPTLNNPVEVFGNAVNATQNKPNLNQQQSTTRQNESLNQNLGNEFENTLLEANDRVYDIQSYPKADFKAMDNPSSPLTIYSPNVNN